LELGITTVELGVQSLNESVLKINNRGHDLSSIENATKLLRTFGFEVVYQIMVGLPGSNLDIDKSLLTATLWQDKYNPDALKIYPCILLKKNVAYQKGLQDWYHKKSWNPIDYLSYIDLLKESYPKIPRYVHVNRIQRVIPSSKIEAGVNLEIDRNLFSEVSKCMWQRSISQRLNDLDIDVSNYRIVHYKQSKNSYCFEAIFSNDTVLGYARLYILNNFSAIIRDIRVLGNMKPVGYNVSKSGCQHIGIGTALINSIEKVAQGLKIDTLLVKPSFGTVEYFITKGFCQLNPFFFGKKLNSETIIELPIEIDKLLIRE
jgi:elongator complex protein 3